MKWSVNQVAELHQMCMDGVSNADMAEHFGVPVTEIHAKRSQLGITIPKVAAMKNPPMLVVNPEFEEAAQEMDVEALSPRRRALARFLEDSVGTLTDTFTKAFSAGWNAAMDYCMQPAAKVKS